MINVLFAARTESWASYQAPLSKAFVDLGLEVELRPDFAPAEVDYIVYAPNSDLQDFTPYSRCKAVLNTWAGVESITNNKTLTQPLTRMVDSGLTEGMNEWVAGHVLRHHLDLDRHITGQNGEWRYFAPPLARDRRVTVLGLGALGMAVSETLANLGFPVTGWSRTEKICAKINMLHGHDGLAEALQIADICVLLLPATAATENLLNAQTLASMPKGAVIINPGRGSLIDDNALLAALDIGQIGHATLDVFRVEPLPAEHRFWAHPKVTVTPHVASETRPTTASQVIAENIRRCEAGEPLLYLVDRSAGY